MKKGFSELEEVYELGKSRGAGMNLASLYVKHDMPAKALEHVQENIESSRRDLPPDSVRLAYELDRSTLHLLKLKEWELAESPAREVLAVRMAQTPDMYRRYSAQTLPGESLLGQGQFDEAEPLLLEGYRGIVEREGSIHLRYTKRITEALERLVSLYEMHNQPAEADDWRMKLEAREDKGEPAEVE